MYDLWLGGKDNYEADRLAADKLSRLIEDMPEICQDNRAFVGRAVRYLAEHGVDQFLDLGCGLPVAENVHQIAQRVIPEAHVVYVDNDPVAGTHGQALLEDGTTSAMLTADFRDIDALLGDPVVTRLIDWSRPVAVLLTAALQHVLDEDDPSAIVGRLRAYLAPGSYLVLSHLSGEGLSTAQVRDAERLLGKATAPTVFRSRTDLEPFLAGFDRLPQGLDRPAQWWPEAGGTAGRTAGMWAVVAQVPASTGGGR